MKFGIFDHVDDSGRPQAEHYKSRLRLVEAMDRLGFHAYHVAEHHGTPLGLAPSPSVYLSAVAQRTTRLRFGPLVYLAALYHPLRLAEEICMLDQMSEGRLQIGIGRGGVFLEQQLYGVDPEEVPERYNEALEVLLAALTTGKSDLDGKYFSYPDFAMVLRPYQTPRPPLWYGIGSPDSTVWTAAHDVNVVSLAPATAAAAVMLRYREEWQKLGKPDADLPLLGLSRHIVVADTDAEAQRIARAAYPKWRANFSFLWKRMNAYHPLVEKLSEDWDGYERMGSGIAGSPATVRDYLARQRDDAHATYVACQMVFGTMPEDEARHSLELFSNQVAPALADRPTVTA